MSELRLPLEIFDFNTFDTVCRGDSNFGWTFVWQVDEIFIKSIRNESNHAQGYKKKWITAYSLVALRNTALPYFKLFMRHCSLALHNASHRCGPKPCRATLVLRLTLWRGFWELKMLRSNGSKWPGWSRLPPDTQTKALKTRSPIAELLSCWHFNVRGFCSNSFQMLETDSVIPYELYELILNV